LKISAFSLNLGCADNKFKSTSGGSRPTSENNAEQGTRPPSDVEKEDAEGNDPVTDFDGDGKGVPSPTESQNQESEPDAQESLEIEIVKAAAEIAGIDTVAAAACHGTKADDLAYSNEVQGCLAEGGVYNFTAAACAAIPSADFDCETGTLLRSIEDFGIDVATIAAFESAGAILVGCAQAADHKTIVGQWWRPTSSEEASCLRTLTPKSVTTGCYKNYDGPRPEEPTSPEGKKAFVLNCLDDQD
jgi:hypothetical protein